MPAYPAIKLLNSGKGNEIKIEYKSLRKSILILRSINHKLRLQLIELLENNTSMRVKEIYVAMRLEQSVASQHLAILRTSGVVTTERKGRYIYYSLNKLRLKELSDMINDMTS